jgi:hypothetical protein
LIDGSDGGMRSHDLLAVDPTYSHVESGLVDHVDPAHGHSAIGAHDAIEERLPPPCQRLLVRRIDLRVAGETIAR